MTLSTRSYIVLLASTAAFYLALQSPAARADAVPQRIPGTQIELVPPAGFGARPAFPGFVNLVGSVMVVEFPQPYSDVAGDVTARTKTSGITLLSVEHPKISGRDATLLHVQVPFDQASDTSKWILIFGDDSHTGTVTATFRTNVPQATSDEIRKSVLSAAWSNAAPATNFEGMQFRIIETSTLKIANKLANGLFLAPPGRWGHLKPTDPLLAVTSGLLSDPVTDIGAFSKIQLLQRASITDVEVLGGSKIQVEKLPGFELTARARDTRTKDGLQIYQMVVIDSAHQQFFIAAGQVGVGASDEALADFRTVAHSLKVVN